MPKNPVRAARQAGRQEVKAARQTKRVANIQAKTASKVAKINDTVATRALKEPATKMESKGITKIATPASKGPSATTPRSMTEVAKGMKPVKKTPTRKNSPSKTPAPKVKNPGDNGYVAPPGPAKKDAGSYVVNPSYDNAVKRARENAKGTYVTKVDQRNKDQQIQAKMDKKKKIRKELESLMPNRKMGGSAYKYGGGMKGKKC
jgi:hypothetical protein